MSQRGGSFVGGLSSFEHRDITRGFLFVRFSIVFESLAMTMSFNLNSSFRTFVCFLYQVKDSDKCFDDSILNISSSVLIFSQIIFVRSEIILFLEFIFWLLFPYYQEITRFQVLSATADETIYSETH